MEATFRPLPAWPYEVTRNRRWRPFKATWSQTLVGLDREVRALNGRDVIIAAGFRDSDIRLDGLPRADARQPSHPGVELSFTGKYGRLIYRTDVCDYWQHNVRSIVLGLEALRAVDRYGITTSGQQYAGWKELPAGMGRGVVIAGEAEAWDILAAASGIARPRVLGDLERVYRAAAMETHPDQGGTDEAFLRVRAAYELLKTLQGGAGS